MQRPVRRQDREISLGEAIQLLASAAHGVLATTGGDGQAYAVPLSFALDGEHIYFHCATEGLKLDNIRANPAVSFCVIGQTKTLPRQFGTEYESAVVFGVAKEIFADEKQHALVKILEKYSPEFLAEGAKYIAGKFDKTTVIQIDITRLTGKARR